MRKIGDMTMRRDSIIDATALASIDKQLIEPDEDALLARQVAPPRTGDHPGTETIVYKKLSRDGVAKIFNHVGADNVPLVDQYATPYSQSVRSIVAGFQLDDHTVTAAQMAGVPLAAQKVQQVNQVMAKKENDLFFSGSTPHAMEGLLNYTGIQTYSVPAGVGGTVWSLKTALEIIADVRTAWKMVELQDNYHATMLVLNTGTSGELHELIGANAQRTVFEFIVAQGWFPAGILTSGCIPAGSFVILQNTPDVIQYALPMDVKRFDPYKVNGFTEQLDFLERYGGALIYRPSGVCVATGIA